MADFTRLAGLDLGGLDHRFDLLHIDAACEILIFAESAVFLELSGARPRPFALTEKLHRLVGIRGKNGLQVDCDNPESVESGG